MFGSHNGFTNSINVLVSSQKHLNQFQIQEVEGLYNPVSENKGADQLHSYHETDLHLCFRICQKNGFPHDVAHIIKLGFAGVYMIFLLLLLNILKQ